MFADLKQFSAAYSVYALPRLRGRDREGACNKIEETCKKTFMCARSPPPQPSPASGGGSRPSSPLALISLHTNTH
jgi:hypothetical protein